MKLAIFIFTLCLLPISSFANRVNDLLISKISNNIAEEGSIELIPDQNANWAYIEKQDLNNIAITDMVVNDHNKKFKAKIDILSQDGSVSNLRISGRYKHNKNTAQIKSEAESISNSYKQKNPDEQKKSIAVNKNDMVQVIYEYDNLTLKSTAIALNSARINDSIKIQNTESNKIIYGKVIGEKLVRVGGEKK